VWPAQIVFVVLAVAAVIALWLRPAQFTRPVLFLLACFWLWMGVVYHALFFSAINPAARGFAVLFIGQAILLAGFGMRTKSVIQPRGSFGGIIALLLIGYALVLYPLIGYLVGHRYPANPTFGLPCPTTLYTFGLLLWLQPLSSSLFVVPVLWALVASTAALGLGVYEDGMLVVAAVLSIALLAHNRRAAPRQRLDTGWPGT
jgi:hypothetical protein